MKEKIVQKVDVQLDNKYRDRARERREGRELDISEFLQGEPESNLSVFSDSTVLVTFG